MRKLEPSRLAAIVVGVSLVLLAGPATAQGWQVGELGAPVGTDSVVCDSMVYGMNSDRVAAGVVFTPDGPRPTIWDRRPWGLPRYDLLPGIGVAYGIHTQGVYSDPMRDFQQVTGTWLVGTSWNAVYWQLYCQMTDPQGMCYPSLDTLYSEEILANAEARARDDWYWTTVGFTHEAPERSFVKNSPADVGLVYLPSLSSGSTRAYDVGANGQYVSSDSARAMRVVGASETGPGLYHAVAWALSFRSGKWSLSDLGTIRRKAQSAAYAVSAWGQAVGESGNVLLGEVGGTPPAGSDAQAVTWKGSSLLVLPAAPDVTASVATAINDRVAGYKGKGYLWAADIVGWGVLTSGSEVALLWKDLGGGKYPAVEVLPTLPGASGCRASGVSGDWEAVAGTCTFPDGSRRAVEWIYWSAM